MTTAALDQDVELAQAIEQLETEIGRARADLAEWEQRAKECDSLLSELQVSYREAAAERVQGKQAPTDKLASQIETLKEKSIGLAHVISTRREQLSDLQARLQPLHEEKARQVQQHNIAAERTEVDQQIAATTQALDDLENGALRFATGLRAIREHVYLDQKTKSYAFDEAFKLQRRSQGMRP